MQKKLILKTPAKINLYLKILGKRADGFHHLSSLMQMIGLYDQLSFQETEGDIQLYVEKGVLAADSTNLVVQAAERLQKEMLAESLPLKGATIALTKNIPVSAGLGGGSSDGAATFMALNRLWALHWPLEKLAKLGAELGSDLPFFFSGPTAWVSGRGELVEAIKPIIEGWILLVHPNVAVSTASVFDEYSKKAGLTKEITEASISKSFAQRPETGEILDIPKNDLEEVALTLFPQLIEVKEDIRSIGGKAVLMSGSGSSFFSIFKNRERARGVGQQICQKHGYQVCIVPVLQRSPFN
ncbi:MAG: 4-(cytidine 5'-diphospho)-2-C-methyl-D-erythritol kinase [Nitrospiria bacterium]